MTAAARAPARGQRLATFAAPIFCAATALAAALPQGSNRPVYWAFWAAVVFAALGIALLALSRTRGPALSPFAWGLLAAALAFALLGLAQSLGLAPSVARDASLLASLRWASYAGLFALVALAGRATGRARFLALTLYGGIVLLAAAALAGTAADGATGLGQSAYGGYVTGSFVNRNSFATFMGFGLVLGMASLAPAALPQALGRIERLVARLVIGLGLAPILAALLGTGSRLGMFASLAGAAVALGCATRGKPGPLALMLAIAALAIAALLFGQPLGARLIFAAGDATIRAELYRQVLTLILERPWLGWGLDGFEIAFQHVHRPPVSPDLVWDKAHSTYLTLWAEAGLVAGSLPPMIGLALLRACLVGLARSATRPLAAAGAGALVLAGLHSTLDFSLEIEANTLVLLTIAGLATAPLLFRPEAPDPSG